MMIFSLLLLLPTVAFAGDVVWPNGYGGKVTFRVVDATLADIEVTRVAAMNAVELFVRQCENRPKTAKCLKKVHRILRKSNHTLVDDYVIKNDASPTGCISGVYKGKKQQKSVAWSKERGDVVPAGAKLVRTGQEMRKFCGSKYWEQWPFFWRSPWSVFSAIMLHEYNHVFGKSVGHKQTVEAKLTKKYGATLP